ncbi:hypothetical protein [Burkholderia ubonensis]|uniref:Uncharacterized protein n=1 Tax=Burkholderia ubonensis TaxID=101571 RepID=A0AB74D891_9BURK|nr:hypothetical protein [Burkholderia ubonensis]PAJ86054.1 hypothetical protein CJO70_19860 [Burkholderia ubonensis]PAJ90522.1 hypothetical protein CJO69_33305 [Burkholderia ubonensis]PAK00328.1 hypothetical protein CJO68_15550 [Burkholderia ubonensis]RQP56358.1 hypothetical protein DF159_24000 [Burkholderia ubonensis]RQP74702.1 hypothetical protein DF015_22615 [Burkholderia ubonensis]
MTLTLDRAGRLCSLDFYTNVDHWQQVDTLPPIPVSPHAPSFGAAFDVPGRIAAGRLAALTAPLLDELRLWRPACTH